MWEEELFEISAVSFERHASHLHQGVEGGLEDVVLVEVGSVGARISTLHAWHAWSSRFPNGVTKQNEQEPESPAQYRENWIVRFGKPDSPILSAPVAVRGTAASGKGVLLLDKWHLTRGGTRSMTTRGVVAAAKRSKWSKMIRKENKGKKCKKYKFNWLCWRWITIGHDLYLYRQQDVSLWVRYDQIFPKQTKSWSLLRLYLFWENRILQYPKLDSPIFATPAFGLDFFHLRSLIPFSIFPCLKTPWILKSLSLAHVLFLSWKLPKPDYPEWETRWSHFFRLVKFGHQ
jgi:hypothetical protein